MDTAREREVANILDEWTTRDRRRSPRASVEVRRSEGLRFAFYGRISTAEYQDRALSHARQREAADRLVAGHGAVQVEFFDEAVRGGWRGPPALRLLRCWPRRN